MPAAFKVNPEQPLTIREQYALAHLEDEIKHVIVKEGIPVNGDLVSRVGKELQELPDISHDDVPKEHLGKEKPPQHKVAIVGAGVSGLFLGMMLDYLSDTIPTFNVGYDIFEAHDSDRVGGRLFTYNFKPKPSQPQGPHDYYDVGAMRFPQNPIMERVFDLFAYLGIPVVDPLTKDTPNGTLVPYSMTNMDAKGTQNEPFRYNDITKWGSYLNIAAESPEGDAFGFNQDPRDPQIPPAVLKMSPGKVVDDAVEDLRNALKIDAEQGGQRGWDLLMKYDRYTTRDWMATDQQPAGGPVDPTRPPFNTSTINYLETMNGGTDWYDQAFSETVLESLDFDYSDGTKWWCLMGGAQQLAILMEKQLKTKPTYSSPVTSIAWHFGGLSPHMAITLQNKPSAQLLYDGVFNTTTLGCLRRIDTTKCPIPNSTKMAVRALAYGQSCKVGIKFASAWWLHSLPPDRQIRTGGLGHSDLHIRTVVYPSYNILDDPSQPAVLLVSYTWQQDAERVGALISPDSPAGEDELRDLLLRELARLHTTDPAEEAALLETISASYLDHYAHDWSHDPRSAGAFAFFRAQQFSTLWPKIVQPAGDLVLVGEAASPHHAWVVGAIESAVAGLYSWLYSRMDIPGAIDALELIDGTKKPPLGSGSPAKNPFLGLPGYVTKKHARWLGFISAHRMERAVKLRRKE